MVIAIPSCGRSHCLKTIEELTKSKVTEQFRTLIVIPEKDLVNYDSIIPKFVEIVTLPNTLRIDSTRQQILENASSWDTKGQVCMVDDDLTFFKRVNGMDDAELRKVEGEELLSLIRSIEQKLDEGYVHVSVSARMGNNVSEEKWVENTRPYRIYAYDSQTVLAEGCSFKMNGVDVNNMDDFHMTLQLLELGYPNIVNFEFCHNQPSSLSNGGASTYHTVEKQSLLAETLAKNHPGFVRVVEKHTETSWGGLPRKDVVISWKKAFGSRASERKLNK